MKTRLRVLIVAGLLGLSGATQARAQGIAYTVPPPARSYSSFYYVPPHYDAGAYGTRYIPPYDYYLAPYGLPAREYVGLGTTGDYPFYGRAYGNPSSPWSWSALQNYPDSRLVRYFYPPVP